MVLLFPIKNSPAESLCADGSAALPNSGINLLVSVPSSNLSPVGWQVERKASDSILSIAITSLGPQSISERRSAPETSALDIKADDTSIATQVDTSGEAETDAQITSI